MRWPRLAGVPDFLAWEEEQEQRFEFGEGQVSLMPGASARHEIVVVNVLLALRRAVNDPAAVRGPGMKVLTESSSRYPDATVTLDPRDSLDLTYVRYPTLLVEVLSPRTHALDRGTKFDEYRTIEELAEYLLVDSRRRWTQALRRHAEGWLVGFPKRAGDVELASIDATIGIDELYAGTGL